MINIDKPVIFDLLSSNSDNGKNLKKIFSVKNETICYMTSKNYRKTYTAYESNRTRYNLQKKTIALRFS